MDALALSHPARTLSALKVLHYLAPVLVAAYYVAAYAASFFLSSPSKLAKSARRDANRRYVALGGTLAVAASYVAEAVVYISRALVQPGWWASQDLAIFVMGSTLLFGTLALILLESQRPVWSAYAGAWTLACVLDLINTVLAGVRKEDNGFANAALAVASVRVLITLALSGFGLSLVLRKEEDVKAEDEERESLLNADGAPNSGDAAASNGAYGSTSEGSGKKTEAFDKDKKIKEQQRQRLEEEGGWWGYLKGFLIFLPYIWPSKNRRVQLYIVMIGVCLVVERVLNVLTPRQLGIIIDKLTQNAGTGELPWKEVGLWIFYLYFGSRASVGLLQSALQRRVEYWSYINLKQMAFRHVMGLSMNFHENKDSGELIKSVDQANSLNSLVQLVLFDTGPVIIDLFIALIYVTHLFDVYFAFVIMVAAVLYIWTTYRGTGVLSEIRRDYAEKARNQHRVLYESVSNWQTISYFNRAEYEENRLLQALSSFIEAGLKHGDTSYLIFAGQEFVMLLGRMTVSFLAAYRVSQGTAPVGNFVALSSYWSTLSYPLWMLAHSYRQLNANLIDAERLLQLLKTQSTVPDKPDAPDLQLDGGRVVFDDVHFAYDARKPTLHGVSFVAEPGTTVALVGETGSGKSTTLKLLFRFYDVTAGAIRIDGQDVRDVRLASLREALGVVPQDPSLFNTSIMDNIRYARLDATDAEVHAACRAAAIHDKIMTFPDGYDTKVGERGVKLSGGELQRVAIARVILKDPRLVLLDEATSAVDSGTERLIQTAFRRLGRGRTCFVIAHRLSTVMHADLILVVDAGRVVERGRHEELLASRGVYWRLWGKQGAVAAVDAAGDEGEGDGEGEMGVEESGRSSRTEVQGGGEALLDGKGEGEEGEAGGSGASSLRRRVRETTARGDGEEGGTESGKEGEGESEGGKNGKEEGRD